MKVPRCLGRGLVGAAVVLLAAWPAGECRADAKLRFDVTRAVECRDVTPAEFALSHPTEKIVEARFCLSLLPADAGQHEIDELLISLRSPERRLRVVDYSPRTEMASEIADGVTVVDTTEKNLGFDAGLGGSLAGDYGALHGQALPTAGAHTSRRRTVQETYKKLPPQTTVIVSGTTDGQQGVFFKIKHWGQRSLEGETELTCRFAVPGDWRGDWAVLTCQARGPDKWYTSKEAESLASATVLVGLSLEGDAPAGKAARRLAELQQARRPVVAAQRTRSSATNGNRPSKGGRQSGLAEMEAFGKKALALVHSQPRQMEPAIPRDALSEACRTLATMSGHGE